MDSISDTLDKVTPKKYLGSFNKLWNYELANVQDASITISNVVIAVIFFVLGMYAAKKLSMLLKKKLLRVFHIDRNSASGLEKFVQYTLITLITLTSLDIANVPLSGLTFVGGALAIGIGFGSQNILNNFISGIIIMIESPIRVGDIIEVEGKIAKVTNIGARCVHLETFDNIDLLVPNSNIIQDKIVNWTLNDRIMRVKNTYYIKHENDVKKVLKILEVLISKNEYIDRTFESAPFVDKVDLCGIKIDLYFYIRVGEEIDKKFIINSVNLAVLEQFKKAKIALSQADTLAMTESIAG
ncbi:MAG: mechanosensitive ion channel [Rickettsiales bacterium]